MKVVINVQKEANQVITIEHDGEFTDADILAIVESAIKSATQQEECNYEGLCRDRN